MGEILDDSEIADDGSEQPLDPADLAPDSNASEYGETAAMDNGSDDATSPRLSIRLTLPCNIVKLHDTSAEKARVLAGTIRGEESENEESSKPAPAVYFPSKQRLVVKDTLREAFRELRADVWTAWNTLVNRQTTVDEDTIRDGDNSVFPKYHFFHTFEDTIQMTGQSYNEEKHSMTCTHLMPFGFFRDPDLGHHFRACGRLNMLVHIPELKLIIVGSPTGYVALITPTVRKHRQGCWRLVGTNHQSMPDYGFHVEQILPSVEEVKEHRKKLRPLHGIAVSPVQGGPDEESPHFWPGLPSRRYRLMMHYRDHSIMTYVITRTEYEEEICLF